MFIWLFYFVSHEKYLKAKSKIIFLNAFMEVGLLSQ